MLQKLKQSSFGKLLYRLSRSSLGAPLRHLAQALQHEALNPAHLSARNRAHNKAQMQILKAFKAQNSALGK
ncbi:hypothetical protein RSK20926_01132 [Roseobacter sp. SK209-2-6]|uniref:hypothetical protein n=1 Tax=Roseobacter sp. SK209-2-6 TaxID=388739 RepID=UPI0000F3F1EB|nr:hypothetical protein [Roseobacter sp. SK209-2-6]EBA14555.1 hypothetical protein RSK20926_01132 [Roseobacter sp. SK209-2-6]